MSCITELAPFTASPVILNTDQAFLFGDRWYFSTGVQTIDFLLDVRNRVLGTSAAMSRAFALPIAAARPPTCTS